jgi:hypothetical protein
MAVMKYLIPFEPRMAAHLPFILALTISLIYQCDGLVWLCLMGFLNPLSAHNKEMDDKNDEFGAVIDLLLSDSIRVIFSYSLHHPDTCLS